MKKILFWFIGLIFISLILVPLAQAEKVQFLGEDVEIMRLKDIKSGMIGYGKSDFGRTQGIEKFAIEIVTITYEDLVNSFVIWIKFPKGSNDIIDKTGVSAGMSGSPIYNGQDELIGALAYGWSFQPPIPPIEADAGVKPIEEMLNLQGLITAYYGNVNIRPTTNPNILKPGDAISAVVSMGDIALAATGTITLSNSKGFLAFGHQFLKTGYSNTPVFGAKIGMVIPSLASSFKLTKAILEPQLGTIVIDSFAGILGIWHTQNTMLPLNINFTKHYLNGLKTTKQWVIKIAPRTPLSPAVFVYDINKAIELSSPDLNYLSFSIKTDFTYEDKGTNQKLIVSINFFSKTGEEIAGQIELLENLYKTLGKAGKKLINIDVDVAATQENTKPKIITLESVELPEKAKPKEKISLGLMLTDDKYRIHSKTLEIKTPDFQGKIEIKVQDANHRIEELINKAYDNTAKINELLDFIKKSANKNDVVYLEIRYIKSITERQGQTNNGWKTADKRTEEAINKEIREIKLPKIQGKFTLSVSSDHISSNKKMVIIKNESDKEKKE